MTAMISAMIAIVRVFMRTFPLVCGRSWRRPTSLNHPAMPDMTANAEVTVTLSRLRAAAMAPLPPSL